MFNNTRSLAQLGWRAFYSRQLTLEDWYEAFPARVAAVQRTLLRVFARSGEHQVTLFVMTSCNADFNPSCLERYLAAAHDARVTRRDAYQICAR
ncbi:MAG TPA: hypothetical protein VIY90_06905 [Steroidobacteraceae bacterium]